ncbi:alpha/beta hydrolase [Nocardioides anomalus]|uniref:Alpha/beta hydrolase n=1 Tax=Nocardioides anomalus TaxID=2712223 RepID=A0A6G6WLH0_9ACTN|nr:alpha/beta hydrolase [Nocardioides anomalus]QIG45997.1 alpha/beta hydrolase [Nocardioides anomalus]
MNSRGGQTPSVNRAARPFGDLVADLTGTDDSRPPVVLVHGLTFDRGMWAPVVETLEGRRSLAIDLPGHGDSPARSSYDMADVADVLRGAITAAGLDAPVVVGHSIGALLATVYASRHPARAVLNIDQPLLAGPFADMLRSVEPVLRGPDYLSVWGQLFNDMATDELSPRQRALLRSTPRQDLLIGYWAEVLEKSADELRQQRTDELAALRARGVAYHHVSRTPLPPPYLEWLRAVLPAVEITVLPGGGHFPHVAHPAVIAELVSRWD